jgi:hypothetical protein
MTSKQKSKILSMVFLILLSGVLIGFTSIPEVKGFPELITDTFEYDSMETLHWDYFDTSSSGVFEIENGVLNYSVFSTAILINDGSNTTWDDFNYLQSNEFSVGGEYGCYSSDFRYEGWVGDNITEIDGVSRLDVDFSFTNSSDNYYWGLRLYLTNNTELNYFENQTGVNTISFEPIDNVSAYGFYFYMKNFPFAVVEFNFIKVHYLGSLTAGDDEMRRELEAEEEEFFFETLIESITFQGIQAYHFSSWDSSYQIKLVFDGNAQTDNISCNIRIYNGAWLINENIAYINRSYFENNKLLMTFTISLEKELNWNIRDFSDSSKLVDYNYSNVLTPLGYQLGYVDFEDWINNDGTNFTSLFYYHYIKTYFYPSPIVRRITDDGGITLDSDTLEYMRLDSAIAGNSYISSDIFYPDLQQLSFIWRGYADSYYEGDYFDRRFIVYVIYDDGNTDVILYLEWDYRSSGSPTYVYGSSLGVSIGTVTFPSRKDFGISINLQEEGKYSYKIYHTPQGKSNFTLGTDVNENWHKTVTLDTTKEIIGVRLYHKIKWNHGVGTSNDYYSKFDSYTVTYGQDIIVPETTFPSEIVSSPDVGDGGDVPFWLLPLLFLLQLIASIFFGIINFIVKTFVEPITNYLTAVIPVLLTGLWNWIITVLDVAITTIISVLQALAIGLLTVIINLFNDVMTFFGISLTWAQFTEFILDIPSLLVSFLGLAVYFFYFIDFFLTQIFIIFAIIDPYITPFFYYFEKYWQIALLWIVMLMGAISLQQQSIDPIISLGRALLGVIMAVVGFFAWIGEIVLWFISFIAGLIRG